MSGAEQALDLAMATAVLGLAAMALFVRRLFHAVMHFIAFGLLMALAWARLEAFDVALAEAAIGAGLIGALLIDAVRVIGDDGQTGGEE